MQGKDWKEEPLRPVWTRPHTVVLATSAAVEVTGVTPWIHHTRGRTAAAPHDKDHLESSSRPREPTPSLGPKATASHSRSWLVKAQLELDDLTALLQPHPSSWLVNTQWKLENPVIGYKWASMVTPGPFPDGHYCRALCYRTNFSHTPGLEFGSEAAISCLLSRRSGEYHPY